MPPTYAEVHSYLATHSQLDAARHFFPDLSESAGRSRVQRTLKAGADDRGPCERAVDALIETWGQLEPDKALRAGLIRTMANTVDWSRTVNTGQGRTAGIQAAQALWKFIEDMGQASGAEDLQRFLASL